MSLQDLRIGKFVAYHISLRNFTSLTIETLSQIGNGEEVQYESVLAENAPI